MADPPQIRKKFWHSADGHLPGAYEPDQRVNAGQTGQLSPAKIETSYLKKTLIADDSSRVASCWPNIVLTHWPRLGQRSVLSGPVIEMKTLLQFTQISLIDLFSCNKYGNKEINFGIS